MITLSLFMAIVTLPFTIALAVLAYFTVGTEFQNATTKKSLRRTVSMAVFQHMTPRLRNSDIHKYLNYSVADLLKRVEKNINGAANGVLDGYGVQYSEKTDSVENSVDSYWVVKPNDRSGTDPVIIYIHGGCFAIQLQDVGPEAMANLHFAMKKQYKKLVGVLIVDYSLTSNGAHFPQQYHEVNWVYDKLVSEGNTNIIVMGDSAGGNLTLNVLEHLENEVESPVWPTAVIPISPMMNVTLTKKAGSFIEYSATDVFSFEAVDYFGNEYVKEGIVAALDDPRVNITANVDLVNWKEIPTIKNGRMLMVFGEYEVLTDEIVKWLQRINYSTTHPDKIVIDPKGAHDGFFINETCDYNNNLDIWKQMYCASRILKFLDEVI